MSMNTRGLTAKQQAFIGFFIENGSALNAAKRAGYGEPQCSSWELLRNEKVMAEITRQRRELESRVDFNLESLFKHSLQGATHKLEGIAKPNSWEILPMDLWKNQELRAYVEAVEVTTTGEGTNKQTKVKVRFSNAVVTSIELPRCWDCENGSTLMCRLIVIKSRYLLLMK